MSYSVNNADTCTYTLNLLYFSDYDIEIRTESSVTKIYELRRKRAGCLFLMYQL